MKVRFNLKSFGVDTSKKEFTDRDENVLSISILESILSLITNLYVYNKYETINIHHTKFSNISNDYRKYLNHLRNQGIILINESYKKGVYSKSYLLTDDFKDQVTIRMFKIDWNDRSENPVDSLIQIDKNVREKIHTDFTQLKVREGNIEKEVRFL